MTAPSMPHRPFSLAKAERIKSRTIARTLFAGGHRGAAMAFPLRAVYTVVSRQGSDTPQAQMLVSVPKRRLKHAVTRNRVKRQVREAYRTQKQLLLARMKERPDETIAVAFVWIDDSVHTSEAVARSMRRLLCRIAETL